MLQPRRSGHREAATILVIDSASSVRQEIREILHGEGLATLEAADAQSGVQLYASQEVDLVIVGATTDVNSGALACEALRDLPTKAVGPILVLTDGSAQILELSSFDSDQIEFLVRPQDDPLLVRRVRRMLRNRRTAISLHQTKKRLNLVQRIAKLGHWEWRVEDSDIYCSNALKSMLGGTAKNAAHAFELFLGLVHPEDRDVVRDTMVRALKHQEGYNLDHRLLLPDGSIRAIEQHVQILRDDPTEPDRVIGTIQDVTDRWQVQAQIRELSYVDQVTGLPNRTQLLEALSERIETCRITQEQIGLIWLGLDHFERINDTLGHGCGDQLLRCISDRIKLALIEAENHPKWQKTETNGSRPLICRLAGDEFVVALQSGANQNNIELALKSLQENISLATMIEGTEITVTSSIGVSVFPEDGEDCETLMRNAGTAMHKAKRAGRNRFQFFKNEFSEKALQHLIIESEMRKALEDRQFLLHYQPKVNLHDNRVEGMEALVRWRHPDLGIVSPADFIPVAEQCGMIIPLGRWVLQNALAQTATWNAEGHGPRTMSVNVSGAQLQHPDFLAWVIQALEETGVAAEQLELELTEGLLMTDTEANIYVLGELARMGVKVSIDDFGTGYSSLSYLTRFPISTLKIDRSFVSNLTSHRGNAAIVSATIALAHSLRMHVVAEGVEERPELDFLRGLGCDSIQGYYFSKPLPPREFIAWCNQHELGGSSMAA